MASEDADSDPAIASADVESTDEDRWPPFLTHGLLTVGIYVVAMSALLALSADDLQGPALATFSVGFSLFMAFYFVAMYVAWLFLE